MFGSRSPGPESSVFYRLTTSTSRSVYALVVTWLLAAGFSSILHAEQAAEEKPVDAGYILKRMAEANRALEYSGIFTYEHGGVLRAVRVTQAVDQGGRLQQLLYLNGPYREIVRSSTAGNCNRQSLNTMPALLDNDESSFQRLFLYYDMHRREDDRIADRNAWSVHLVPKDGHRYGYALAVDQQTGVLLQAMLVGTGNRVLERFHFVDLSTPLPMQVRQQLVSKAGHLQDEDCGEHQGEVVMSPQWQLGWMPPGFSLVEKAVDEQGIERGLYSDGLSAFSVFIDPAGGAGMPEVQAQRGATVAQLQKVKVGTRDYAVCVVGEIPVETAQRIAGLIEIVEK